MVAGGGCLLWFGVEGVLWLLTRIWGGCGCSSESAVFASAFCWVLARLADMCHVDVGQVFMWVGHK